MVELVWNLPQPTIHVHVLNTVAVKYAKIAFRASQLYY